jgi:hypothetical protein
MKGGFRNMKYLKNIMTFLIYYLLGYLIFNIFIFLTQLLIYKALGLTLNLIDPYIDLLKNNFVIYTIIYFLILVSYLIYNTIVIKILNEKLQKIKKVGGKYEK